MKLTLFAIPVVAAAALGGLLYIQTNRLDNERERNTIYRAQVEALGEVAARRTREADAAAIKAKELSDAENAAAIRNFTATAQRLRKQLAAGGGLSSAAPAPGGPEVACYDRTQLIGALRGLDTGVLGLLEEGDRAIVDLNTAKRWASGR